MVRRQLGYALERRPGLSKSNTESIVCCEDARTQYYKAWAVISIKEVGRNKRWHPTFRR